eukprot:14480063-Alexandrium_andersonii.AAC.1
MSLWQVSSTRWRASSPTAPWRRGRARPAAAVMLREVLQLPLLRQPAAAQPALAAAPHLR